MSETILWHIEVSHFNEKARWALEYKGVPYEKRTPMPALHGFSALRLTRGKQRRLPVMELDGERIGDSTAIIAALEKRFPEPALYPEDPGERAAALNLEDFFDEHLAADVRRFMFEHTLDDVDAVVAAMMPNASETRKRVFRAMAPVGRRLVRADYSISAEKAELSVETIRAAMDRLERELNGGEYLVGNRFSVADLTGAALFTPLLAPAERPFAPKSVSAPIAEFRAELEARPGGQWVHEIYRRHRAPAVVAATAAAIG